MPLSALSSRFLRAFSRLCASRSEYGFSGMRFLWVMESSSQSGLTMCRPFIFLAFCTRAFFFFGSWNCSGVASTCVVASLSMSLEKAPPHAVAHRSTSPSFHPSWPRSLPARAMAHPARMGLVAVGLAAFFARGAMVLWLGFWLGGGERMLVVMVLVAMSRGYGEDGNREGMYEREEV